MMNGVRVSYVGASGVETSLDASDGGFYVTGPLIGAMMPPVETTSVPVFDQPGARPTKTRFGIRTIGVPFAILAETQDDLRNRVRDIAAALNPVLGAGKLRVAHPDGQTREIGALYTDGLALDLPHYDPGTIWHETEIDFLHHDPLWVDTDETVLQFTTSGANSWFGSGKWFGPTGNGVGGFFDFGGSTVFGNKIITNAGDDLAWPVWTIRGPGNNLVLTNVTTGAYLDFTGRGGVSLPDGNTTMTVDTRPGGGSVTITDALGVTSSIFPKLVAGSDYWPIVTGDNELSITMPSANDASRVSLSYRLRYLTA